MTHLRQRMLEDMQLGGLAPKTQDSYLPAVRQLAEYCDKSPDQISEAELRGYFLYLKNEKQVSRSACTVALCGIKFFYEHTLQRQWATFDLVRPPKSRKLPVVLTQTEVRQLLDRVRRLTYRVCLTTIYSCGLRLGEAEGGKDRGGDGGFGRVGLGGMAQLRARVGDGLERLYSEVIVQFAVGLQGERPLGDQFVDIGPGNAHQLGKFSLRNVGHGDFCKRFGCRRRNRDRTRISRGHG